MTRRLATAVGILSGLVSIPALGFGLLWLLSSPFMGLVLLVVGVVSMEGGVYLVRHADEPAVLSLKSPVMSGAIALFGLGLAAYALNTAWKRSPIDEPLWLNWALYGVAVVSAWMGIRAGWHATRGRRPA